MAQFLSLLQGERNPADLLWQAVNQYGTDLAAGARALAGDELLLASTRQRLTDNADLLAILAGVDPAGPADTVLDRATRALVTRTLARYLSESLGYTPPTTPPATIWRGWRSPSGKPTRRAACNPPAPPG
ncbi:hypothetical protein ASALC70_02297 [Alcanivorax sp. ALC70]|nr:hypothetical protein ASALC70_02297 [Alcanivorax sp. ALC70]